MADAACFPAAAGQHLRLHRDWPAERGRGSARVFHAPAEASVQDEHLGRAEQLLGLVLVELQSHVHAAARAREMRQTASGR